MLSATLIICFTIGIAIVMALTSAARHTDGTIARVLYGIEHPEKKR
jgi:hypothetical protein